jgi:uncharacterized protein YuzE
MRVTYDPAADAADVQISDLVVETARPGYSVGLDPRQVGGAMIFVHFDGDGFVRSLEILGASRLLRPDVLAAAVLPDPKDLIKRRVTRPPRPRPAPGG